MKGLAIVESGCNAGVDADDQDVTLHSESVPRRSFSIECQSADQAVSFSFLAWWCRSPAALSQREGCAGVFILRRLLSPRKRARPTNRCLSALHVLLVMG